MLDTKFWEKYFAVYDVLNELIPYQELLNTIVERLDIQPSDLILDAGSGTGNLAVLIEKKGARVIGVDSSEVGVRLHKKKIPGADVRVGDLTEPLPFSDGYFDKVYSNNVIYTLLPENRSFVFSELYRVLKPGGMIVVSNIKTGFSPAKIYGSHVKMTSKEKGVIRSIFQALSFLGATIKMFYYNSKIKSQNKSGGYRFLSEGEQGALMTDAGFVDISADIETYANQALLTSARKAL